MNCNRRQIHQRNAPVRITQKVAVQIAAVLCYNTGMEDLGCRIRKHSDNLELLQVAVEQIYEAIDVLTGEAHEKLTKYQEYKQQANVLIEAAAVDYQHVIRVLRQVDILEEKLKAAKNEHIILNRLAYKNEQKGQDNSEYLICQLDEVKTKLQKLYSQLEDLRKDNLLSQETEA